MEQEHKEKEAPTQEKKKSYVKKIFKWILYVVIGFIVLNLLLYGLLSIPYVQRKALDFALNIIKEKVQTEVRIDGIRLSLFNNVHLQGIYIEDQAQDTLVYAQKLNVSLSPWRLLKSELLITEINLENFNANISQENPDANFNFQFLVDAFAGDTTVTDTTQSSTLRINIKDVTLKNGNLRYDVWSEPVTPGQFNASHIHLIGIDGNAQLPSVDMMDFDATISSLSFIEVSGLELKNLKASVTSDRFTFYLKDGEITLPNSSLKIPSAQYNLFTSAFELNTEKSVISPQDILPVMTDLKYLKHDIILLASLKGKLPLINVDSLLFDYGNDANIRAGMSISDYANYDQADIKLNISRFQITPDAISDFAKIGDSTFIMPDILKSLGTIRLEAMAHGKLSDINLQAEAWAKHGALQLRAKASVDTTFENYSTNAQLQTQNFNLGSLLEMPELGRLSADMNIIASQTTTQPLEADAKGRIVNIQYNKEDFSNIPFTAYYNSAKMGVWLNADLPQGKLEAKVDMTQSDNPRIDADVNVQNLQINKFYEFPEWKNPELSLHLKGNITGMELKDIKADMVVENFKFSRDSVSFQPGTINFQAGFSDSLQNYIHLQSSLLNASIEGEYNFMTFSDEFSNTMNLYLPGIFPQTRTKQKQNNFSFVVSVHNTEEFSQVFNLPVNITDPLIVKGNINTIDNDLKVSAQAPNITYGEYLIKNTLINISNTDSLINLTGDTKFIMDPYDISLDLQSVIQSDSIQAVLNAKRDSTDLDMNINLDATAHFDMDNAGELISYLKFKPTLWDIGTLNLSFMPAEITNAGNKTSISNFGFMVGRGRVLNKYFGVDGAISDQPQDTLNVSFFHANLGYLLQAFDIDNISTIANGDIHLTHLLETPELYTDNFRLSDIIIFNDTLGTLNMNSQWSEARGAVNLDASLVKDNLRSSVTGHVFTRQDSLDLTANFDRLSLAWLQPFMSDMLNHVSGSISSQLTAKGKINAPEVRGWLGVNNARIGIDYTNVTYLISDTIEITPEKIGFDNLIVQDPNGNRARVDAIVTHQKFENLQYNLDANLSNFMVLNTASRTDSLFYGKIFASGTVNIKGSDQGIDMNMNIRNARNSSLNIQIPQTADAVEYPSIVFINTPNDPSKISTENLADIAPPPTLPLKLKANVNISPDLLLGVVINPTTGDYMEAKGSGLVDFTYDMESEAMNAFGQYTLSDGFVKMKLQNIATVEFKIQQGSKLIFNGDPMKTNFNITAYKRVRADLRSLDSSFGTDQYNSPMVMADAVLGISGNMDKMNLTYNISLPDASDDVQQRVRSILVSENERVRQFASLVVTGSFATIGSSAIPAGNMANSMLTSVASSALSSGLNAVLGNMIGSDWQIGTNIQSDDGTFDNMDMSVSLSRSFLDNRLEFNTNLGYRTDQANDNSFIGDFDVTYALTRSIKLKVFNKTNDRYYRQAPMTQGVGIVYTREAKTIKQLFRFFRKSRRPANNQNQVQRTNSK